MIRIVISIIIFTIFVTLINLFPIFIPHLQYAGFFFMQRGLLEFNNSFVITYIELIILLIFMFKSKMKFTDKYSKLFFLLPVLALPTTVNAYFNGNIFSSIYLLILLGLMPFYYQFLLKKMNFYIKIKLVDYMILSLIVAGIFNKLYQGYVHGPELAPYMHPLLYGLVSRGGGMNASNHIGGIILILLPLISNKKVLYVAILFLIICFSRGIYFILGLFIIYVFFTNIYKIYKTTSINKQSLYVFIIFLVIFIIFIKILPQDFFDELVRNSINRLSAFSKVGENERFHVFSNAIDIFKESYYLGVGPANFYYGYDSISVDLYENKYSNAHNLYLTLLVENGIGFLLLFLYIYVLMLYKSFHYNRKIFFSLSIFLLYGLFSGQLYETGMGKVSLYDYYYLMYLIAYIRYLEINRNINV